MPIVNQIVGPAGGTIDNQTVPISGGRLTNLSGVGHGVAKMLSQPAGWREIDGYKEHFRPDDTAAVRYFRGPWGQRKTFVDWCLGHSFSVFRPGEEFTFDGLGQVNQPPLLQAGGQFTSQSPPSGFLSRIPPAQHPEYPWMYAVECELVRGEGAIEDNPNVFLTDNFGDLVPGPVPVPMISYYDASSRTDDHCAVIAVTYRNLDYEIRTDREMLEMAGTKGELERHVTRTATPAIQALPVGGNGAIRFKAGAGVPANIAGQPVPESGYSVLLFTEELVWLWRDVPDVPHEALAECVGKVNANPFDGARGCRRFAAQTLLMQAPTYTRKRSPVGRVTWDVGVKALYRPQGWNSYPAADGNFYEVEFLRRAQVGNQVVDLGPVPGPYGAADFDRVFVPPAPVAYQ